ncbi:MAG: hypothetical protein KDD82_00780, partial [Planctomycetes bacterium]|nr:hypothetical protein [Planctomycetota bacterium]
MHFKTVAGLVTGLLLAAGTAQADPGWEKLGERAVDFGADRDTILVTAAEGRFRKIRLHVRDRAITIADLKVHFGNGETQDVTVRAAIPKDGSTREIDLDGGARVIKKVTLVYSTAGAPRPGRRKGRGAGKAQVALWGLSAAGGADPATPPATPATPAEPATPATPAQPVMEWVLLGQRAVKFAADRDHIPVTAAEGRFNRLRFHVAENDVIFDWIKVTFGNGEVYEINPAAPVHVKQGTDSRAFDLPGALRVIQRIDLKYRTPLAKLLKGQATVRAFGKRVSAAPAAPATPAT